MKHVFVFDPKAFYNQQWKMDSILDSIGQFFRTQTKTDFSVQISRYRRDAVTLIQSEIEKAKQGDVVRVYAVGGEEILFDCVNGLTGLPNTELAVVPHGETTDFLKNFGEDKVDLFKDIPTLVQSNAIPTDLINWGVNYAINSCVIGLNSATAFKLQNMKSSLNKNSFILFSKISTAFSHFFNTFNKDIAAQQYKISVDDRDFSGSYSLIHIANGPYQNGKKTGLSNAMPDDGLLDIALIKSAAALKTLWSMSRYTAGKLPSNCVNLQAKSISIESDKKMWIQLDNEYIQDTKLNLSVVHQGVSLVTAGNITYSKE
jgi:diacylglycerol kinase family enzyme